MNRSHFFYLDKITLLTLIIVTALTIALGAIGEKATMVLRYEHELWQSGEWWRMISGHFVHLSWTHLALNLAGLWLIALLFEQQIKPTYTMASAIVLAAIGTSAGLFFFSPEITWYVGLSGILHGLVIIGATKNISSYPWPSSFILLTVSAKIIWEQLYTENNAMETLIGGNIVYDAHFYGAVSGAIIIALFASIFFLRKAK